MPWTHFIDVEADRHALRGADDDVLARTNDTGREQRIAFFDGDPDDAARADVGVRLERAALDLAVARAGEQIRTLHELADGHDRRDAFAGFHADEIHDRATARRARAGGNFVDLLLVGLALVAEEEDVRVIARDEELGDKVFFARLHPA
jgi:hypothetical protein